MLTREISSDTGENAGRRISQKPSKTINIPIWHHTRIRETYTLYFITFNNAVSDFSYLYKRFTVIILSKIRSLSNA